MKIIKILLISSLLLMQEHCIALGNTYYAQQGVECSLCDTTEPVVYEDSLAFIIKNRLSTLKTSLLIVPKEHIKNLDELKLDSRAHQHLLAHLISLVQMLAGLLAGAQEYRISINTGFNLQKYPHLCVVFESNEMLQKA